MKPLPLFFGFVAWICATSASATPTPAGLNDFLIGYHCAVYNRLIQIDQHSDKDLHDRFLVLSSDPNQHYTQVFLEADHRVVEFEASSYFYEFKDPAKRRYPSARSRYALSQLGFDMASGAKANYQHPLQIDEPNDLWVIADLLLESLYRGYDAKLGRVIVKAPFAGAASAQLLPMNEPCRPPLDAASPESAH
jgi:hypothetical protein